VVNDLGNLAGPGVVLEERRAVMGGVRGAREVDVSVGREMNALPLAVELALVAVEREGLDGLRRGGGRFRRHASGDRRIGGRSRRSRGALAGERHDEGGREEERRTRHAHPFTHTTCLSRATTSTRSAEFSMTSPIGLYAPGISSRTPVSFRHSTPSV